jgi:hypothetical protein
MPMDWDELLEALGDVRFQFWVCPIDGHSEGDWSATRPVTTVEWIGDVAHCRAPGCNRTSADPKASPTP